MPPGFFRVKKNKNKNKIRNFTYNKKKIKIFMLLKNAENTKK